jgi:hypothetical protein
MMPELASSSSAFARLFDPVTACFTPEVAEKVASVRADKVTQARIDELAEKCNEGEISPQELAEYEAYALGAEMLAVMQAQARRVANLSNT